MGRRNDAFEVLRANDLLDETTVPDADSPKARSLLTEIVATPRPQPHRIRRPAQRRLAMAVAIAILAILSIAATWLALRGVADPISVGCYQATSLDSDVVVATSGGFLDISLCEPVWEDGTLTNDAVAAGGQAPPLMGCVTDQGNLAVFPSSDENLCHAIGLAGPAPESITTGDAIRQLNDDLVVYFVNSDCQTIEDARTDIREMLDRFGFDEWRIEVFPGGPGRQCASFGLDAPNHTVHLIPIPPPN